MVIFPAGYGGRKADQFVQLLVQNGVHTIVDVRLRPDRASMGIYVKAKSPKKGIKILLATDNIGYVSRPELGNLFLEFEDWQEKYQQLMDKVGDPLIQRLDGLPEPSCLMCAERSANDCHREQIADYLAVKGYEFKHLE